MIKSIKHLRGTAEEWQSYDIIVPDGEIAILKGSDGGAKIKIGNGRDKFSALPFFSANTVITAESTFTLENNRIYRLGRLTEATFSLPDNVDDDFYCEISFDTSESGADISFGSPITLTGDEAYETVIIADAEKHYTVCIWYDGRFQGAVRGAPCVT